MARKTQKRSKRKNSKNRSKRNFKIGGVQTPYGQVQQLGFNADPTNAQVAEAMGAAGQYLLNRVISTAGNFLQSLATGSWVSLQAVRLTVSTMERLISQAPQRGGAFNIMSPMQVREVVGEISHAIAVTGNFIQHLIAQNIPLSGLQEVLVLMEQAIMGVPDRVPVQTMHTAPLQFSRSSSGINSDVFTAPSDPSGYFPMTPRVD